jgi:hypothetical protein
MSSAIVVFVVQMIAGIVGSVAASAALHEHRLGPRTSIAPGLIGSSRFRAVSRRRRNWMRPLPIQLILAPIPSPLTAGCFCIRATATAQKPLRCVISPSGASRGVKTTGRSLVIFHCRRMSLRLARRRWAG